MNFSKRSFHFAIFSLILMVLFLALSAISRDGSTSIDSLIGYLITLFFVTVIIGFVLALISLKEPSSTIKYIGFIVNLALFALLGYNSLQNLSSISQVFS